jgi:hypothetical protein
MAAIESTVACITLGRTLDRGREVTEGRGWLEGLERAPRVDVLVATYSEGEILTRTIVGALGIDFPDVRVWVLDEAVGGFPTDSITEDFLVTLEFDLPGNAATAATTRRPTHSSAWRSRIMLRASWARNRARPGCAARLVPAGVVPAHRAAGDGCRRPFGQWRSCWPTSR